jgi:predicted nucleic-acid-binding Zn-ribbon protein
MRTGQCPKCGSSDIRAITDPVSGGVGRLQLGLLETAGLDYYVCVYCGYVEGYIAGVHYLQWIAARYPRMEKNEQAQ